MIRAACIALACASPALAQSQCGPREAVIAALTAQYGESVIGRGLIANQQGQTVAAMEVWVNPTSGSFTVLLSRPDGTACFAASGGSYEAVKAAAPGIDG